MVISRFSNMVDAAIFDAKNLKLLVATENKRVVLHYCAEFRQNRSNYGQDMAIFLFSKMADAAIVDFKILEVLTVGTLKMAKLHPRAKFCQNQSSCGRDMAIFRFSNMAAVHHLGFVMRVFGPPMKGVWLSLSLCKIWLESIQ